MHICDRSGFRTRTPMKRVSQEYVRPGTLSPAQEVANVADQSERCVGSMIGSRLEQI